MATSTPIKCRISEWGLPPLIISWFRKKGITSLFEWQVECLTKDNVLFGDNLVYSAPTSAGKTLVADFLLIKRVLENNKKALVIEPFVALTREKADTLKSMLYTTSARVGAFGGNYYTPGGMAAVKVAVCTIEKANNFINKLINENKLSDLGIVVVDEIHYLGDERRGYQLELLLTKILYFNSQQDKDKRIQIVGLSATIPNLSTIANWLNASLYVTSYRPVPLLEKIKIDNRIYAVESFIKNPACDPIEMIDPHKIEVDKDFDDLCYICIDSIIEGHSVLVFCESKRECEIMASNLAEQIKVCGNKLKSDNLNLVEVSKKLRSVISKDKIKAVMDKLKRCPAGVDKELVRALDFGIGFHHAGLTSEEREIVEDGFKSGAIKTLMATSTLSSGVNLPARRVVIRSPTMVSSTSVGYQKEMLNPSTYRQMIGRAGRKNIDNCGESILICRPDNKETAIKLIKSSLGNISSSLAHRLISDGEPSGLKKALLEVIANSTAQTKFQLNQYLKSTFWLSSISKNELNEFMRAVAETLRYLVTNKFIEELKPGVYRSTRLGNAVLASGLHPDDSLELLQDLLKARQGFCLLNDLHIIYQVTPNDIAHAVDLKDWQHYSKIWHDLDEIAQFVGQKIGIDEITLARRCQGFMSSIGDEKERVYRRFWVALVINDLVQEMPLPKICDKYRMSKAMVQQAQRAVAQFAGVMSIFCQELGYDNIAALVTPLESRINFSCQRDLLDLIRLNLTRPIARALFNGGYKTPMTLAKADKLDVEFVIRQIKPFKKDASFTMDSAGSPSMWVPELAKNMTILDYASHIVDSARSFVEVEFDIDLAPPVPTKRKQDEPATLSPIKEKVDDKQESEADIYPTAPKRGRTSNGSREDLVQIEATSIDESSSVTAATTTSGEEIMVKPNREVPNYVVKYVPNEIGSVNEFMDRWVGHSSICLNFKLAQKINEPIGAGIKSMETRGTSTNSQEGLKLRYEIDNRKHIVTKLYAAFDEELDVYVIEGHRALEQIRDNLKTYLDNLYHSEVADISTQRQANFRRITLYTQDIILTYKVLNLAFNLDHVTLNKFFEWQSFDVAWWMINECPNRGPRNCNSSLSLVTKTNWATKYHHFLYPRARTSNMSREEYLRLRDIVKSGKTAILKPLIQELVDELEKLNQLKAYSEVEVPARLAMAPMLIDGIGLEMKQMRDELNLYQDLSDQLNNVAQKYYSKSPLSLSSVRDIARVLYDELDLRRHLLDHSTITNISKDSTNAEILTILSQYHPFPKLVQDYRKIGKAIDALQNVNSNARFHDELKMSRVMGHCDFWQTTGRVAMSDPDLFLINRNFTVIIPKHGNRPEEAVECVPRKCFVPIPGWTFVAADYSQLELRLLAHFSNDTNLLDSLNQNLDSSDTFDVFRSLASQIYKKSMSEITDDERQHTKQICYGIIYGMGNTSLANKLGVDVERAEEFRQDFFATFPSINTFIEETREDCGQKGFVESLFGRRRDLDHFDPENSADRSKAKRVCVNTRIQSSASDLIKLAMQSMNRKILKYFSNNARLVLEMHDELIYEVNPVILTRFAKTLKFTMENMALTEGLKVKLLVNLKVGPNWSNLDKYNTEQDDCPRR